MSAENVRFSHKKEVNIISTHPLLEIRRNPAVRYMSVSAFIFSGFLGALKLP
jgi:hypothetical protein